MDKQAQLLENRKARLEVLAKISQNEKEGGEAFFNDVEIDPPYTTLKPDDVDYECKKFSSKIKSFFANIISVFWAKKVVKDFDIEVVGEENIRDITTGAVITSNHFSIYENVAVWQAVKKANGKHKFYRVIREGNYFMPGIIGFLLRHARTLPISSHVKTMMNLGRTIDKLLKKGEFVLVYPEKAMWWNYRKPRPYKVGAFHYAAKANVPVVPMFVTMTDMEKLDENGFPMQKYTIHVMPAIYPDPDKTLKENGIIMMDKNAELTKAKYEEVYGIPLSYKTEENK